MSHTRAIARLGLGASPLVLALAVGACSSGIQSQRIGLRPEAVAPGVRTELACLHKIHGGSVVMLEGAVAGTRAVSVTKEGLEEAFVDRETIDDAQVFTGMKCVMFPQPLCDNGLVVSRGYQRIFVHWATQYASATDLPSAASEAYSRAELIEVARGIDLDAASQSAVATISRERERAANAGVIAILGASATHVISKRVGHPIKIEDLREPLRVAQELLANDDERGQLAAHPKLANVLSVLEVIARSGAITGSVCVGLAPTR